MVGESSRRSLLASAFVRAQAFARQRFIRQAAVLITGTVLAQGLVMLTSPIVTRLYAPAALGMAAVFTSLINLLSKSSAAYQLAVPLPHEDRDAVRLLQVALTLLALASALTLVAVGAAWFLLPDHAWAGDMGRLVWLLPLGTLTYGAFRVLSYWPIRKQNYRLASLSRLAQAVALVGVQIAIGVLLAWPGGMIVGVIAGATIGALVLLRLPGNEGGSGLLHLRWPAIRATASNYRRFPLHTAIPLTLESIASDLPVIMIAAMFDAYTAGLFALSTRILAVPASLLAETVERVFLGEASIRVRDSLAAVRRLQLRMALGMAALGLPVVLVLVIAGPALFGWIFGPEWEQAGVYVRLLAPMYLMLVVAAPTQSTLAIVQRQDLQVPRMLMHFIMPLSLLVAFRLGLGATAAVLALSIAGVINYSAYLVLAFIAVRDRKPRSP